MGENALQRFWSAWRNSIAFWILGICNNFVYVVMLSAAVDIIEKSSHGESTVVKVDETGRRQCQPMSTGAVLLADIAPGLIIKIIAPTVIHKLHFHLKVTLSALFALASMIIVALSKSMALSLFGVVCASISNGLGDVTFLTMIAFFKGTVVSPWSSGTGAAGVIGAMAYAALTSFFSPETTLLIVSFTPILMLFMYFVVLEKPDAPVFHTNCSCACSALKKPDDEGKPDGHTAEAMEKSEEKADSEAEEKTAEDDVTVQVSPSWAVKKQIMVRLSPLIIALALVYFFEYVINMGLFELVYFPGTHLSHSEQYRWYQVTYQWGVFASRSSLKLYHLKQTWILAIFQGIVFVLVLVEVIKNYVVNIWAFFALVAFEGIVGGLSYVNTYHRVLNLCDANTREFGMAITVFSDSFGVTCAAFAGIQLHNWLCSMLGR